jgi:hypothetical protein
MSPFRTPEQLAALRDLGAALQDRRIAALALDRAATRTEHLLTDSLSTDATRLIAIGLAARAEAFALAELQRAEAAVTTARIQVEAALQP